MQPVVVDAEVVRHLVHHRDPYLVDHILEAVADRHRGPAVDRDAVREGAEVGAVALRKRDAGVEAEEVGVVSRGVILDDDDDVAQQRGELARNPVEGLPYEILKLFERHIDHGSLWPRAESEVRFPPHPHPALCLPSRQRRNGRRRCSQVPIV